MGALGVDASGSSLSRPALLFAVLWLSSASLLAGCQSLKPEDPLAVSAVCQLIDLWPADDSPTKTTSRVESRRETTDSPAVRECVRHIVSIRDAATNESIYSYLSELLESHVAGRDAVVVGTGRVAMGLTGNATTNCTWTKT